MHRRGLLAGIIATAALRWVPLRAKALEFRHPRAPRFLVAENLSLSDFNQMPKLEFHPDRFVFISDPLDLWWLPDED